MYGEDGQYEKLVKVTKDFIVEIVYFPRDRFPIMDYEEFQKMKEMLAAKATEPFGYQNAPLRDIIKDKIKNENNTKPEENKTDSEKINKECNVITEESEDMKDIKISEESKEDNFEEESNRYRIPKDDPGFAKFREKIMEKTNKLLKENIENVKLPFYINMTNKANQTLVIECYTDGTKVYFQHVQYVPKDGLQFVNKPRSRAFRLMCTK